MTDAWDDPQNDDWPEEDDSCGTVPCPNCGGKVYEDAEQCPLCGEYIVRGGGRVWSGKPLWWLLLGLAGVLALVFARMR